MAEDFKQWEYRVQTTGVFFGTKDEHIQAALDKWVSENWEAINVFTPSGSGKITLVAKRPLTERTRRIRSMPQTRIAFETRAGSGFVRSAHTSA